MTEILSAARLWGYVTAAAVSSFKFCLVVIPLVAIYEVLKGIPFLARQGRRVEPWAARLNFSPQAVFPLSAGMFLGLLYGAGIIISETKERALSGRDILVLSLFLAACHAVVEDTLLFVVIGGNGWWILGPRFVVAVAATWLVGRLYRPAAPALG